MPAVNAESPLFDEKTQAAIDALGGPACSALSVHLITLGQLATADDCEASLRREVQGRQYCEKAECTLNHMVLARAKLAKRWGCTIFINNKKIDEAIVELEKLMGECLMFGYSRNMQRAYDIYIGQLAAEEMEADGVKVP